MTVRADITGRYSNRMYAYEPGDLKLRKWTHFILKIGQSLDCISDYYSDYK